MLKWLISNWERVLFSVIGLAFILFSLNYMISSSLVESSAAFGMGFLCFIFSSVSRFKRFKGLGFEAELWEDKQEEAAELIDRFKDIVTIYSREAVMSRVTAGRWEDGAWKRRWELFDELTNQHQALGQKVDFSKLKKEVDNYFIFDMVLPLIDVVGKPILDGRSKAHQMIDEQFGSPIRDIDGHRKRHEQLHQIEHGISEPFVIAQRENLAAVVLNWSSDAQRDLKTHFAIDISFDSDALSKLKEISTAYSNRPIKVTERLIALADGEAQ